MLDSFDLGRGTPDRAKKLPLRAAKTPAGPGPRADRTMMLDQQQAAIGLLANLGHIAFARPLLGEAFQFSGHVACRRGRRLIAAALLGLARRDQAIERLGPQLGADGFDQFDREPVMAVRKLPMARFAQRPAQPRPADRALGLPGFDQPRFA